MKTEGNARCQDTQWWLQEGPANDAASKLTTVVRHIRDRAVWRREADVFHAKLYAGGPGAAGIEPHEAGVTYGWEPSKLPRNVCRQGVDTLQAKVAKHRPLPQCLTSRGKWAEQKRARKQTQYLEGVFHQTRFFEKHSPMGVRDAGIFGRGIVKIFDEGDFARVERVLPTELLVDDWDARYGDPRSIYQVRTLDVGVCIAKYGRKREGETEEDAKKRREAIYDSATASKDDEWDWISAIDSTVLRVRIVEAYHLCDDEVAHAHIKPSKHECTGRRVIAILDGVELENEAWEEDCFPYAILNFCEPLAGFWGSGMVEQLTGWQLAINEQFERVQEGHHMLGGGMILAPLGSDCVPSAFNNGPVPIIEHNPGKPPQFVTPAPVHPAVYQRERDMPVDALGEVGLSQQSVQSVKQPGVEAAIAIQTLDDIESERHIIFGRAYESWCLTIARLFIRCAIRIAKRSGDMAVGVPMKGGILDLKWSDVSLNDFQLRVFPTSLLPQQLGARLEKLKMLFEAQLIDRQTFLQQLDAPDLAAELDLETADRVNIDEKLEAIRDADEDELDEVAARCMPSQYQNFRWAQKRAQQVLNKAESDGCPEANLDAIREFIDECQVLIDNEEAKQPLDPNASPIVPGTPPAPGMPPPMPPGMPPVPPMPGPPMGGGPLPVAA